MHEVRNTASLYFIGNVTPAVSHIRTDDSQRSTTEHRPSRVSVEQTKHPPLPLMRATLQHSKYELTVDEGQNRAVTLLPLSSMLLLNCHRRVIKPIVCQSQIVVLDFLSRPPRPNLTRERHE